MKTICISLIVAAVSIAALYASDAFAGQPLFSDEPIWTSGSTNSGGDGNARWIDFDKDGDPDLVTSVPNPRRWALFRNENGKLASKPCWESKETTDCDHISVLDFNGDGWLDLAVGCSDQAMLFEHLLKSAGPR